MELNANIYIGSSPYPLYDTLRLEGKSGIRGLRREEYDLADVRLLEKFEVL